MFFRHKKTLGQTISEVPTVLGTYAEGKAKAWSQISFLCYDLLYLWEQASFFRFQNDTHMVRESKGSIP